jgi:hypothetical protein
LFVMIYVGGGINFYDKLGPDAIFCLQSPHNLTSLAAYVEQWSRAMKLYFLSTIPAIGSLIVLLSIFVHLKGRKFRLWKSKRMNSMQGYELLSSTTGLTFFSLSKIRESIGNFMALNVIGKGGFNSFYSGTTL